jgi:hypothetical protein
VHNNFNIRLILMQNIKISCQLLVLSVLIKFDHVLGRNFVADSET